MATTDNEDKRMEPKSNDDKPSWLSLLFGWLSSRLSRFEVFVFGSAGKVVNDFIHTARFFGWLCVFAVGTILVAAFCPRLGVALSWGFASLMAGSFTGFLFGIPKVLQANAPKPADAPTNYRQEINTNFTEISDWVTKIIVGLGLVNLKEIPDILRRIGRVVGKEIKPEHAVDPASALALGITMSFGFVGFLFGYLSTRLYVATALARADQEALKDTREVSSNSAQLGSVSSDLSLLKTRFDQLIAKLKAGGVAEVEELTDASKVEELSKQARGYNAIASLDEKSERIAERNKLMLNLATFIQDNNLSRKLVLAETLRTNNEGLIGALATVINSAPLKGDLEILFQLAKISQTSHAQERIVLAFGPLFRMEIAEKKDFPETKRILERFAAEGRDDVLRARSLQTLSQISLLLGLEPSDVSRTKS